MIGLDRDQVALNAACTRLAPHGDRVIGLHRRFDEIAEVIRELGHHKVSDVFLI